jgi:hypothetical protein
MNRIFIISQIYDTLLKEYVTASDRDARGKMMVRVKRRDFCDDHHFKSSTGLMTHSVDLNNSGLGGAAITESSTSATNHHTPAVPVEAAPYSMRGAFRARSPVEPLDSIARSPVVARVSRHVPCSMRSIVQQSLEYAKLKDRWAISYEAGLRRVGLPSSGVRQETIQLQFNSTRNKFLIAAYGHRTAVPLNKPPMGLRTYHKDSTLYFRDSHTNINYLLKQVIKKAVHQGLLEATNRDKVYTKLVGSDTFQAKFKELFPLFEAKYLAVPFNVVKLSSGLYAVVYQFDSSYDADFCHSLDLSVTRIHYILGATPSYQPIIQYLSQEPHSLSRWGMGAKRSLTSSMNQFHVLQPALEQLAKAAQAFPSDTRMIAELSIALVTRLPSSASWFSDALMNDGLRQIGNLMAGLSVVADDFVSAVQIYDLIIDELSLVLNTMRPYSDNTIHAEQTQIYQREIPSLMEMRNIHIQSLVTASSGMGAISTALSEAKAQFRGAKIDLLKVGLNYFEVAEIVHLSSLYESGHPVIMTTLNPSLPIKVPQIEIIITKVEETLELYKGKDMPIYLIIDTTMNTGDSKLDQLISQLQAPLEQGSINIVLCKSFQKYDSLGTGKIMAGNITTINNGSNHYRNFERGIRSINRRENIFEHNNGQLLAHLLKCHDHSLSMMQKAAEGARFINDFCWPAMNMEEGSGYIEGLPFVMRYDLPTLTAVDYLEHGGTEKRDTFGFIASSVCPINGSNAQKNWLLRINPGVDTKEQLVERFFCMGHLFGASFIDNIDEMLTGLDALCSALGQKVVRSLLEKNAEEIAHIDNTALSEISRRLKISLGQIRTIMDSFQCLKGASTLSDRQQFDLIVQYEANIRASIIKGMSALKKEAFSTHADHFIAHRFCGVRAESIENEKSAENEKSVESTRKTESAAVEQGAESTSTVTYPAKEFILIHRFNQLIASPESIPLADFDYIVRGVSMSIKLEALLQKIPDSFFDESNVSISRELRERILDRLCEGVPFTELVSIGKLSLMMGDNIHKAKAIVSILEFRGPLQTEIPDFFRETLPSLSADSLSNHPINHQTELDFLRSMIATASLFLR